VTTDECHSEVHSENLQENDVDHYNRPYGLLTGHWVIVGVRSHMWKCCGENATAECNQTSKQSEMRAQNRLAHDFSAGETGTRNHEGACHASAPESMTARRV
jgi:hypothetical protein